MGNDTPQSTPLTAAQSKVRSLKMRIARFAIFLLLLWAIVAYLLMPNLWKAYAHLHPALEDVPDITHTASGIPGDPLNVALIGSKEQLMSLMAAAKWYPADPLSLKSSLEIAEASVLKRPDDEAPVSNLYLWGRKEDLAFEKPVDNNPRQRHHVRFWRSDKLDSNGQPLWIGSAIYDDHVGLSRTTGQITHHTAANVDWERDYLFHDLEKTGRLTKTFIVNGFHKTLTGKNGGGDPWFTDGNLYVGIIAP